MNRTKHFTGKKANVHERTLQKIFNGSYCPHVTRARASATGPDAFGSLVHEPA